MKEPKNILITGASSGIGEALAMAYAGPGIRLAITGRNEERLNAVADKLRQREAQVFAARIDVADQEAMASWVNEVDDQAPLDLVIANAGIGVPAATGLSMAERTRITFDVNVNGVFHTIHPALERMKVRQRGQVAIMSSVAGLMGLAGFPAYSASKNAVRAYGEALRGAYAKHGIEVNVVCPGFVVSRMTANNPFRMPFLVQTEDAAKRVIKGLARNKGRIVFPWPLYAAIRTLQLLPVPLAAWITKRGPSK